MAEGNPKHSALELPALAFLRWLRLNVCRFCVMVVRFHSLDVFAGAPSRSDGAADSLWLLLI